MADVQLSTLGASIKTALSALAGAARLGISAIDGLGSAASQDVGTAEGDIPVLGPGGKLDDDFIPAGVGLPVVGSNGQVLTVVSGEWAAANPSDALPNGTDGQVLTRVSGEWAAANPSIDEAAVEEIVADYIDAAMDDAPPLNNSALTVGDAGESIWRLPADMVAWLGLGGLSALLSAYTAASASGPGYLLLGEDTDNGANTVKFTAPAALSGDVVLTAPGNTGDLVIGVEPTSSVGGAVKLFEGTSNGSNYALIKAADAQAANRTHTLPDADGTLLSTGAGATLTKGYAGTEVALTLTGTVTPNIADGQYRTGTNNAAFTLGTGMSWVGTLSIVITNGATAGAITTTGWILAGPDAFDTINGHVFRVDLDVRAAYKALFVKRII